MAYRIKIVLIGDHSVGKSSLTQYMREGKFNPDMESTIGCLYSSISYQSKSGYPVTYDLWDTAGQERYRSLCSLYLRDAHVILLCIDTSIPWNNYNIEAWMSIIEDICIRRDKHIILVGTKVDLPSSIQLDKLRKFCHKYSLRYFQTSSKVGEGVENLLKNIYETTEVRWEQEIRNGRKKAGLELSEDNESCCLIS